MKRDWSVYILRCGDDSLYTGVAKDVDRRLEEHNKGKGAAYTRARRPVRLLVHGGRLTRSCALSLEARIKTLTRKGKEALLAAASARGLVPAARALVSAAALLLPALAGAAPAFNKESAIVFSSAAPVAATYANAASFTYPIRLYYIRQSTQTEVGSASSADGVSFTEDSPLGRISTNTTPSVSASSITGMGLLPLDAGGFRALYAILSTTNSFRIHSATSANGLAWANETGSKFESGGGADYMDSPALVELNSGDWRIYYVADFNGGNSQSDYRVLSALSTNQGVTWGASSVVVSTVVLQVGAAKRTDGRVRLFLTQPVGGASSATVIASALSSDANGSSFSLESGLRLSTGTADGTLARALPVRSTDSFKWRLYYNFHLTSESSAAIRSALTTHPDVVSVSPSAIMNTNPAGSVTILGEIFSASPSVRFYDGGSTHTATSVTRTNDQSLTATFNASAAIPGLRHLTVQNNDGNSGTLTNALLIDFPPGSLTLTDNLLRPRDGGSVSITVQINNPGDGWVRVHTLDGRLVRAIYEGPMSVGSSQFSWDGKDAAGGRVPSGVYLVHVRSQKLDVKKKVVIIQ